MSRETVSDRHSPTSAATVRAEALAALDEVLFVAGSWFCLDAGNQRVRGVLPGTLQAGLALVGQGSVATIAGQLLPGRVAVDVDAGGPTGDAIAAELVAWCAERGLWHLARRSGPTVGRWHVFTVPGEHTGDLAAHVVALRAAHGVRRAADVELRRVVRPLSAPHRSGGRCPTPQRLAGALRGLRVAVATAPGPAGRLGVVQRAAAAAEKEAVAVPLPRPRRLLPAPWRAYLDGQGPCPVTAAGDRSTTELAGTFQLVVTGHSEPAAWEVVTDHPRVFAKAVVRGRRWWRTHVWAAAVASADTWLLEHRGAPSPTSTAADTAPSAAVSAAAAAARAALEREWLDWAPTGRHSARAVLDVLLDRMERTGSTTVPCPERDLLLDTAVRSRTTLRAALVALEQAGFGFRVATFRPGSTDPAEHSHTWILDERFTRAEGTAVSLPVPPGVTPPHARNPGLWRLLGLRARHTYLAVAAHPTLTPDLDAVAHTAGMVSSAGCSPTVRQLRTTGDQLRMLAALGMVASDAGGRWSLTPGGDRHMSGQIRRAARASQVRVEVAVADERASYRTTGGHGGLRWQRDRDRALRRAALRDRGRHAAWWQAQSAEDQRRRRTTMAAAFAAMPISEQADRKATLAHRRAPAGVDEDQRRLQWLRDQVPDELTEDCAARAAYFARLAPPEQIARASAWQHHRNTHGTTRTWPHAPAHHPDPSPHDPVRTDPADSGQLRLRDAF